MACHEWPVMVFEWKAQDAAAAVSIQLLTVHLVRNAKAFLPFFPPTFAEAVRFPSFIIILGISIIAFALKYFCFDVIHFTLLKEIGPLCGLCTCACVCVGEHLCPTHITFIHKIMIVRTSKSQCIE